MREARDLAFLEGLVQHVVLRMAQVGDDRHALEPRVMRPAPRAARRYPGRGTPRQLAAVVEGEPGDDVLGQHGELAPRHVSGRQALARDRVERRAGRKAERRRGDVDADAQAGGEALHREGVVDLRGADVVQAECRAPGLAAGRRAAPAARAPGTPRRRGRTRGGSASGGRRGCPTAARSARRASPMSGRSWRTPAPAPWSRACSDPGRKEARPAGGRSRVGTRLAQEPRPRPPPAPEPAFSSPPRRAPA